MSVLVESTEKRAARDFGATVSQVNVATENAGAGVATFVFGVRKTIKKKTPQWKVIRKFRGMVLDTSGATWLVGFEVGGKLIEYEFPRAELERNAIKARFQPFEMDELQSTDAEISGTCYRYRPLAGPNDALIDHIELSAEDQRLRDLIFAKFGNPQS